MLAENKSKSIKWGWRGDLNLNQSVYPLFYDAEKKYFDMPLLMEEIKFQVTNDGTGGLNSIKFLELFTQDWMSDMLHGLKVDERIASRVMLFIAHDVEINRNDIKVGEFDAYLLSRDWFLPFLMDVDDSTKRLQRLGQIFKIIQDKRNEIDVRNFATLYMRTE
ncbi:hypothetical protein M1439_01220 [Candidatus Marsarchaeota archaeon]|nr:hypothetical protein [Candidatus Marsarchaeota archaeon]MCL5092671.1 hypothetical protein [Candidatus Marsarchaeota archaeon]